MMNHIQKTLAFTTILFFYFVFPSFSHEISQEQKEQIVKRQIIEAMTTYGLQQIYAVETAFYAELGYYTDSFELLGLDPVRYARDFPHWNVRIYYASPDGFVAQVWGVLPPVVGEVYTIDQAGVVVGGRY